LGDLEGRALGRQVGVRAWQKAQKFFDGSASPVTPFDEQLNMIIASDDVMKGILPQRIYLTMVFVGR
jgi:hypothetical protein